MSAAQLAVLTLEQLEARDRALVSELSTHLRDLEARLSKRIDGKLETGAALLSQKQVAARLGVSVREIQRMKRSGEIPKPVMVGNRPRWEPAAIEKLVRG